MPRKIPFIFLSPTRLISFSEHNPKTRRIYGIEIFAPGSYRGIDFTNEDIQEIAENFQKLKTEVGLDVPLKVDHTDEANGIVGWITDVEEREGRLYADAEITEPEAFEKIVRGTWKKVSCEIYLDFTDEEGKSYGKALRAVAIVAHPQVKKIKGLEVARFFEKILAGKEVMKVAFRDAISGAFGWLSERFKRLAEEAEKDIFDLSVVRHSLEYDLVEEASWDAAAAEERLRRWASSDGSGKKETIDWTKYREAFAWYDADDADSFTAYKLPHHDIVNGRFSVVWRGVAAAMTALKGARGGVDIPLSDREAVYNHLARHYQEFEREMPELAEKGIEGDDEEMKELEEKLKALEDENVQLRAKIEELEKEIGEKLEEEKGRRVGAIVDASIEKGKLIPAEKGVWAEYLLSLSEEELARAVALLDARPALDLYEERGRTISPEEEERRMSEEVANRLLQYIAARSENK